MDIQTQVGMKMLDKSQNLNQILFDTLLQGISNQANNVNLTSATSLLPTYLGQHINILV